MSLVKRTPPEESGKSVCPGGKERRTQIQRRTVYGTDHRTKRPGFLREARFSGNALIQKRFRRRMQFVAHGVERFMMTFRCKQRIGMRRENIHQFALRLKILAVELT